MSGDWYGNAEMRSAAMDLHEERTGRMWHDSTAEERATLRELFESRASCGCDTEDGCTCRLLCVCSCCGCAADLEVGRRR